MAAATAAVRRRTTSGHRPSNQANRPARTHRNVSARTRSSAPRLASQPTAIQSAKLHTSARGGSTSVPAR